MATFLKEDSKKLNQVTYHLPKKVVDDEVRAKLTWAKANGLADDYPGVQRLNSILDGETNHPNTKDDKPLLDNPQLHANNEQPKDKQAKGITNKDAERIIHDAENTKNSVEKYLIQGVANALKPSHDTKANALKNQDKLKPQAPKVQKVSKTDALKPLQTKDGSQVHIVKENQNHLKLVVSENQLQKLYEFRNELNLPFKEYGSESNGYKLSYEHYLDYIEKIGKYGTLPSSNINRNKVNQIIDDILLKSRPSNWFDMDEDIRYYIEDLYNKNQKQFFKDYDSIQPYQDLDEDLLSTEGKMELFYRALSLYGFPKNLIWNDNNLIYIERIVGVPNMLETEDIYQQFVDEFSNIGKYWSWDKGGAEDFGYNNSPSKTNFVLKGWVDPKDVDWEFTVCCNVTPIQMERELTLQKNSPIQIDKITYIDEYDKQFDLPLKQPIILHA